MSVSRYLLGPDPAWDWSDEPDGVLSVELSWVPDALAGRLTELVASPELVAALTAGGITGFTTGPATGYFDEQAELDVPPPELIRLVVGDDPGADLAYLPKVGLSASRRATDILEVHCSRLDVSALDD